MSTSTKTANKINAFIEIQNQFVFVFEVNEEVNKEMNEEEREMLCKKIESIDQEIREKKCEVDNYNLHISKKTGGTFERLTNWRCSIRLNIQDIEEAKNEVKRMKKEIENLENELKKLRAKIKGGDLK